MNEQRKQKITLFEQKIRDNKVTTDDWLSLIGIITEINQGLNAENARLRAALEYYANFYEDGGVKAREALKGGEG